MFITAIAAALLASSNAPVATETPAPQPTAKTSQVAANPRVCLVDQVTGSRIPQRTCKRLADWHAAGLDPFAKR